MVLKWVCKNANTWYRLHVSTDAHWYSRLVIIVPTYLWSLTLLECFSGSHLFSKIQRNYIFIRIGDPNFDNQVMLKFKKRFVQWTGSHMRGGKDPGVFGWMGHYAIMRGTKCQWGVGKWGGLSPYLCGRKVENRQYLDIFWSNTNPNFPVYTVYKYW